MHPIGCPPVHLEDNLDFCRGLCRPKSSGPHQTWPLFTLQNVLLFCFCLLDPWKHPRLFQLRTFVHALSSLSPSCRSQLKYHCLRKSLYSLTLPPPPNSFLVTQLSKCFISNTMCTYLLLSPFGFFVWLPPSDFQLH